MLAFAALAAIIPALVAGQGVSLHGPWAASLLGLMSSAL